MKLQIKTFVDGVLASTVRREVTEDEAEVLGADHARRITEYPRPMMIEVEFLDDPTDPNRFLRVGSDPTGMRQPQNLPDYKPRR